MSHTEDIARGQQSRSVENGWPGKTIAYLSPDDSIKSLWMFGELQTYKIPSHQTGGAYSLFEVTTPPEAGPPSHVNHREDESFYVLEGGFEFLVESRTLVAGAGSLIYVPKGTLHTHKNVDDSPGKMLVTQTPGGLYEQFFEEVSKPTDGEVGPLDFEDHPDVKRIVEVAAKYGIEIPLPITQ